MAKGKLDLPDDFLSSKPSDRPWTSKMESSGGNEEKVDESKEQLTSESSIPLSPQWLYTKPSETKMDTCVPNSVSTGNSSDPNQKEGWRLDGSEEKKDWRRIPTESESNRCWREEERETGLLGSRRDRRKGERRFDTTSMRETTESRSLSSSDRWHDSNIRNLGHESRRDSKWRLGGVLKTKRRNPALRRGRMLKKRRKILTMTISHLLLATVQFLIVTQILVINGGHAIEWRCIQVVQLPLVRHLDLDPRKEGWRVITLVLPLDGEDQLVLEGLHLQAPSMPFTHL